MKKDNRFEIFITCWIASLVGIVIFMTIMTITISPENLLQEIEECEEHEFVITSEYDYFRSAYKTVSKCANCGLIID